MYDYSESISEAVKMTVTETEKDVYQITIIPDDAWLQAATYPVTIDPTINCSLQADSYFDTYVSEANEDTNYSSEQNMILSSTASQYRGLMYFDLPTQIMDKEITYATYTLTKKTGSIGRTLALYMNTSNFLSSVTWESKPETSPIMTDYHIVGANNEYVFNITEAVREWQATGNTRTSGFTIRDKNVYGLTNEVYSEEWTEATQIPVLEIGYIDPAGIKDYWTYHSQQVGENSTGYVSDFTGMLNIIRNDISFSTERQTLSLSFGYNINDKSVDKGYYKGWNIVYNNYIKYDSFLGLFYSLDYTGNKVYYHATPCDSRFTSTYPVVYACYLAEDGSGNILVQQSAYGTLANYSVYTKDNIRLVHNRYGYLTSIINEETNQTITVTRYSQTSDKVVRISDSSGNKIELTYTDGNITKAQLYLYQDASTSNLLEEVNYSYGLKTDSSGNYVLEAEYSENFDETESMTIDESIFYDYDTGGRIISHYQINQDKIEYTFNTTTNKVINIKSYYETNQFGEIEYEYSLRKTTVTNQNNDFIIYKFDSFGHTVNIFDSEGNIQFYKYLNIFSTFDSDYAEYIVIGGEPNYRLNHCLISQSDPQTNLFNPINNHGFEYDGTSFEVDWNYVDDNGELRKGDWNQRSDETSLFGYYSAMINASAANNGHFEQTITLDSGTYTLTGYVNNQTSDEDVWIDIVGEDYGGEVTYVINNSEWTKVTITFGISSGNDSEITILLNNHSTGKAFFDNIEIYAGFVDNRTNMIDNASFEMVGSIDPLPGWHFSNSTYVYRTGIYTGSEAIDNSILGDYAIKIFGSETESRSAVTSITEFMEKSTPEERGHLIVGAWGLSQGMPTTISAGDYADGNDRYFRIRVDFVSSVQDIYGPEYEDSIIKSEYINFDTSIEGWQYQYSRIAMPNVNTYWVNVFFEYKGIGTVYFDGLQISFENSYTNYEYNQYGNLIAKQSASDDRTDYIYDETKDYSSKPTQINYPDGTVVNISVDENEKIYGMTYNNVTSTLTYNEYGQVTQIKTGNETTYFTNSTSYTHLGQYVLAKTNEFNNITDFYSNPLSGLLKAIENAKGQDTHYIYDNEGKLVRVASVEDYENYITGEEDALVEYMYDINDRLWKIILDSDYYYEISYDDQGRMSQILVNNTPVMNYTYEMDDTYYTDRLSEQAYGNGDVIKFEYNDKEQIKTIQFKEYGGIFVNRFSYEYDNYGRIAVYNTFENGLIIASEYYTYNYSGELIKAVDEAGNTIKYTYDNMGNLTSLSFTINGVTQTTNYANNECIQTGEETCIMTNLYDQTEYTTQTLDTIIKDYHYETSAFHRLNYIYLTGNTFNAKQNFIYSGNTTRINQITYEINGTGIDYRYVYYYDSLGNITHEYYYEGTAIKLYRNYEYDDLNQLVVEDSRDYRYGSTILNETNYTKFYYYDLRGNRTDVKTFLYGQNEMTVYTIPSFYMSNSGNEDAIMLYGFGNDYRDIYNLNIGQTPSLIFTYYDASDIYHEYPISGMTTVLLSSNLNTGVEGYYYRNYRATNGATYDLTFRIVFKVGNPVNHPTIPQEHIHYNYSTNWEDQLLSYGEIEYINGVPQAEAIQQQYTYDLQGNPIIITNFSYAETIYEYAVLSWSGRELTQIDLYNALDINEYRIEYTYNDQGYRTNKTVSYNNGSSWQAITIIDYESIGSQVIYENGQEYNTVTDEWFNYDIIYTYDVNGTIIGFSYSDDDHTSADYFYLRNQQGDITQILDANGTAVIKYKYDAYGNITDTIIVSGYNYISNHNSYTYKGYRYDSEIKMYYLNSRYYNPQTGRFINADGMLGQLGDIQSTNMYAYCANNPVMYTDSTGESWNSFWNDVDEWIKNEIINPAGQMMINTIFLVMDNIVPDNDVNVIVFETIYFFGCGGEISYTKGFCIDRDGNIGSFSSFGLGADLGCGVSVGWGISTSNAPTIYDFKGYGLNIGGSFGIPIAGPISVGPGYEWAIAIDNGYTTNTYSLNIGIGKIPFEMHASLSNSWVYDVYSFGGD